jgi:soluble lytic murein transglycosylase
VFKTILISALFLSLQSSAQIFEEKLDWAKNLSLQSASRKEAVKEKKLALQKKFEVERKWAECSALGKSNVKSFPLVKGWIYRTWLKCVRSDKNEKRDILTVLRSLDSEKDIYGLLGQGPWRSGIWSELIPVRILWLEQSAKKNLKEAWKQIDILLDQKERLDRSQKAKIYQIAGELGQLKAQLVGAKYYFQRSLNEQDSKVVQDKLKSLRFALNEAPVEESEKDSVSKDPMSSQEEEFEDRFKSSSKANDLISVMEDCLSYLDKFPNGRRAKWAQDRMLEIYLSFDGSDEMQNARSKALAILLRADSSRLVDWARQLHRRADNEGGLKISEQALTSLGKSPQSGVLLYIAGRSAQLTGDYKKAEKYFEHYVETQSGTDDYPEILFRLGLSHLRLGQASSAIAIFEKLLLVKNKDRFELSARYWLTRALQATHNVRALVEADGILSKYPFSYYGLRLRIERGAGMLEWPAPLKFEKPLKGTLFFTASSKAAWNRVSVLARNSWNHEAAMEAQEIPTPFEAPAKILYAKSLTDSQIFPPAIRLLNDALDMNGDFAAMDVYSMALPLIYKDSIDAQAKIRKFNPILVRSLIRQESAFGSKALSTSNALGLMQLIPPTAEEVANDLGLRDIVIPEDIFRPEINIQMGTFYLAKMVKQFGGNVPLGLAAYNAGPGRMQKFVQERKEVQEMLSRASSDPLDEMWFDELPWFETSFYVKAILRNTLLYRLVDASGAKNPDQRRVKFSSVLWSDMLTQ